MDIEALKQAIKQDDLVRAKRILYDYEHPYDCEYFAQYVEKRDVFVYVDHPQLNWSYADFRVFIGPLSNMVQVKVQKVERMRCGDTYITLEDKTKFTFASGDDVVMHGTEKLRKLPHGVKLLMNRTFL